MLALAPSTAVAAPKPNRAVEPGAKDKRHTVAKRDRAASKRAKQAARRRHARQRLARRLHRRARRNLSVKHRVAVSKERRSKPSSDPDVLFRGDFEAGFDGWHVQSIPSRATLFSGGAFQGSAARFEVADGDVEPETDSERSEVSGPTFDEGQDLYIRDAIRVPSATSFEGSWQIIQQLHETDWGGSPGIAVFLDEDNALEIGAGDGSTTYWEGADLQHDRWYDLVYRAYLSQDSSEGFVEVWLDGVQQTLDNGGTRAYGQTIQTSQTYLKAGIYRGKSSEGTSLIEHDSIVVATSFAAATAG
jgi:polysaccharide lyase-like protein